MSRDARQHFELEIDVSIEHLDENGHVNNVAFVQWMQDVAVAHADHVGCTEASRLMGASWYVRSHHIDYKMPAFPGDTIVIETEVGKLQTARSTRTYRFVRRSDDQALAVAQTEWVFVDSATGRPKPIPASIAALFGVKAL